MIRPMLRVLMDEIKDANMVLDYYDECDIPQCEDWFFNWGKKKTENAMNMFSYVNEYIQLDKRAKEGDELAAALEETLEMDVKMLQNRLR